MTIEIFCAELTNTTIKLLGDQFTENRTTHKFIGSPEKCKQIMSLPEMNMKRIQVYEY